MVHNVSKWDNLSEKPLCFIIYILQEIGRVIPGDDNSSNNLFKDPLRRQADKGSHKVTGISFDPRTNEEL